MNEKKSCSFCNMEREIKLESELSFAIYDSFPVNEGHALIITKRHTANYFDLTLEEQIDCIKLLNRFKGIVQEKYNPAGFNVGININESAGQTVPHVHIHLIPRYKGDVEEPRGGVRGGGTAEDELLDRKLIIFYSKRNKFLIQFLINP